MRTRHATSLVELMVIMSACSIILTTSAGLVHRAMHAQSATRSFFDGERSALRLAEQFRSDVHVATAAVVTDGAHRDGLFLRLDLADGNTIEYRQADSKVTRLLTQHGSGDSRAEFAFTAPLELAVRDETSPRRLILSITAGSAVAPAADSRAAPLPAYALPLNLEVEACLGRERQIAISPAPQEVPK